jgi:coenzyme F420-reducing hydrogenase gamma subunit
MKERIVRAAGGLVLAIGVAACAGGLSGYSKTGVSDQQKSTDYYECQRDSSVPVWRSKMQESVPDTEKMNACMRARGYTVL